MSDDEEEVVDEMPGHANSGAFSDFTPGDPQIEYGVVDLSTNYPATTKMWQPEYPRDAPREKHLVVPFEVVARGFTSRSSAESAAEHKSDVEDGTGDYKVVVLSDTRGL